MMLLQAVAAASAQVHPLSGTIAEWVWLLPVLPLIGFVSNGLLSLNSAHFGPADPGMADHHPHSPAAAEAAVVAHGEESGAPGDNHHAVKRHRWAGVTSIIGPGVVILAFGLAVAIWQAMVSANPEAPFIQRYFSWMPVGDLQIDAAIQLDQLSMVMVLVITGVGALIHIFSVGYMRDDPGYPRYFSYLNLFVFFMLVLVLGSNYPVLFVGWEGVGLCSYLLIGFWFSDKVNADAGKKAFIVNRIGDFAFLIGIFFLFSLGCRSLEFRDLNELWKDGVASTHLTTAAICLFIGACGKSAQI
ncbi:MAG TPA: proton-conducting transporter membrane subunit, partial [Gemmatimonadaceae bacterium]|nr:proton-conducting transporter membrane subunit [Gemmatimonadaceae bacterium]